MFPNNVIRVTGKAATFAFESKKVTMCIPEYDRSNDILFEEQNKHCVCLFWFHCCCCCCFVCVVYWEGERETFDRGGEIGNGCSNTLQFL